MKKVMATVLVYENIDEKEKAYQNFTPIFQNFIHNLLINGIKDEKGEKLASLLTAQTSTGECDYILQIETKNVESLMSAINIIRQHDVVYKTITHIGAPLT